MHQGGIGNMGSMVGSVPGMYSNFEKINSLKISNITLHILIIPYLHTRKNRIIFEN